MGSAETLLAVRARAETMLRNLRYRWRTPFRRERTGYSASNTVHPESVLFLVLDSCRYDTFISATAPRLHSVGHIHCAHAPSHFTFGSHAAMFVGFTPGVFREPCPLLNPKVGKVFKLVGAGFPGKGGEAFVLRGRNIVDGFNKLGYHTAGTGGVSWFDPATPASHALISDFGNFYYPGNAYSLPRQIAWIERKLSGVGERPVFVFLNIGETHVPYYFAGAPWSRRDNPCVPFQVVDRSEECRRRQVACIEFVDSQVSDLLSRFAHATTLICSDHGDCWGEDGLWEHGISHPMTLTVPMVLRVRGRLI